MENSSNTSDYVTNSDTHTINIPNPFADISRIGSTPNPFKVTNINPNYYNVFNNIANPPISRPQHIFNPFATLMSSQTTNTTSPSVSISHSTYIPNHLKRDTEKLELSLDIKDVRLHLLSVLNSIKSMHTDGSPIRKEYQTLLRLIILSAINLCENVPHTSTI